MCHATPHVTCTAPDHVHYLQQGGGRHQVPPFTTCYTFALRCLVLTGGMLLGGASPVGVGTVLEGDTEWSVVERVESGAGGGGSAIPTHAQPGQRAEQRAREEREERGEEYDPREARVLALARWAGDVT